MDRESFDPMQPTMPFPGQRMRVLPRPLVRRALQEVATSNLLVTDAGYFPRAVAHSRFRPHGTPEAVLLFVSNGRGAVTQQGRISVVEAGSVAALAPNQPHAYEADAADPWTLWWIHVAGSLAVDWCSLAGASGAPLVTRVGDPVAVTALFDEILRLMERDTTRASLLRASGAAWHLMTRFAGAETESDASSDPVERAADHLRHHFAEQVSVPQLAAIVGLSASYFATSFRRRFGQPVHRYQLELRMSRARELLDTTSLPVGEVARLVGFDDAFYFSRRFRIVHGQTPREFRRRVPNGN